jgi:hypothetical protein
MARLIFFVYASTEHGAGNVPHASVALIEFVQVGEDERRRELERLQAERGGSVEHTIDLATAA